MITSRVFNLLSGDTFAYSVWHTSFLMFLWGLWLMFPIGTFESVPAYAPMAMFASSFTWGLIAASIGLAKLHFIIVRKKISLGLLSFMSGYYWAIVGISFLVGDPVNTGGLVYMMISLYDFWVYKVLSQ